jgi:transcriptional regulator with GAF, ATPase, and Fis domain
MSRLHEIIGQAWEHLGKYGTAVALLCICILILFIVMMSIVRHKRGDEIELDFKITKVTLKPNSEIRRLETALQKLTTEYETVSRDSRHKVAVLNFLDQVGQNAQMVLQTVLSGASENSTEQEMRNYFDQALSFILHIIEYSVRDGKSGLSRIAIFVPDDSNENLVMLKGLGYSPQGQSNLTLPMESSFAGGAFRNKEVYHTGDIQSLTGGFVKLDQQRHSYHSLVCVPIMWLGNPLGVLNVDCAEKDAFSADDADVIKFFANQLALLLFARNIEFEINKVKSTSAATDVKGAGSSGT